MQQPSKNGWRKVATFSGTLGSTSRAVIKLRYRRASVIGTAFRILAYFPGGSTFGPANHGYWYFKITH